jgi:hypothetical protein
VSSSQIMPLIRELPSNSRSRMNSNDGHKFIPALWRLVIDFRLNLSRDLLCLRLLAISCFFCGGTCAQTAAPANFRPPTVPAAPPSLVVRDYKFICPGPGLVSCTRKPAERFALSHRRF